jgi:hypothetical protein
MSQPQPLQRDALEAQRRRNIRRTTMVLVLVALGIYVAFIASGVLKAH